MSPVCQCLPVDLMLVSAVLAPRPVRLWFSLFLLFVGVCSEFAQANAQQGLVKHEVFYQRDVSGRSTAQAMLESSAWLSSPGGHINLGFSSDVIWVKFMVSGSDPRQQGLLEIANHKITQLDVYIAHPQNQQWEFVKHYQSAGTRPISQREYPHRSFIFPLSDAPSDKMLILIRVKTDYPIKLPINVFSEREFYQQDTLRTLFHGFYLGTVFIMAFYNLFIYFYVRDKSYATYVLFIVLFSAAIVMDQGLAAQYLWPEQMGQDFRMYLVFVAVGAASSGWFTINFLSLRENTPRLIKVYYVLLTCWLLMAVYALFFPSMRVLQFEMLMLLPGGASLLWAGIYAWRIGVAAAPYYTISWCVVIFAVLTYSAHLLGWVPVSLFAEYVLQVGGMIEATLLSLGLAHRIKALDEEKRSAHAKSEAKSEFLATMSHEVRTPMNGILGMAQLLKDTALTRQQTGYLNTILGSGQTLLTVLNDILDYSKIEAGKLEVEKIPFNVRRLVDETAGVFAVTATQKGVYYNVFLDPQVPIKISGDPTRVRQIITNFLSNAFKFTATGKVTLHVSRDQAANCLRFEVRDSGIGIPADKQAGVFEKFTQADSSTSRRYGGTGLGLPISRRLVEMMGGAIGVHSSLGQGSVFWFSLPIHDEVPFDHLPNDSRWPVVAHYRFLVLSPHLEFLQQIQAYSDCWQFGLVCKPSIHQAIADLPVDQPGFDYLMVDHYCEDFSLDAISEQLRIQTWARSAQLILIMRPGAERKRFEQLDPPPWIEEYPVSITRIQLHFLTSHGINLKPLATNADVDLTQLRVLLVEDNPVNAKVATAFLKKLQVVPQLATDGDTALAILQRDHQQLDLVLLDCEMPGMDGYTVALRLRAWEQANLLSQLHICALSAHAMESHKVRCLACGMNDFITKPLMFDALRDKLVQVASQRSFS